MVQQGNRLDLTDVEAKLFIEFRRHQENLTTILGSGALDHLSTSFTCHLDGQGIIRRIDVQKNLFTSHP